MAEAKQKLTPQELEKVAAEAERHRQLAKKAQAETRKADAEAEIAGIMAEQFREGRMKELAADSRHHIYRFVGSVDDTSVRACMSKLAEWSREEPKPKSIEVCFTSPGGSIISGMALFDYIQQVRREGIFVTTSTLGYAASMAGILLQAGDHRVMNRESWLLIHQASFGASGSFGDIKDTVKWVERMQERIVDIFVERSKVSKPFIKKRWERTDWWVSSDEALKFGFVDEVR